MKAGEDYNYLHWVVDPTRIEVLAVLPRIRGLEDSHGLTGDPITASSDCACRRTPFLKSSRQAEHEPIHAQQTDFQTGAWSRLSGLQTQSSGCRTHRGRAGLHR